MGSGDEEQRAARPAAAWDPSARGGVGDWVRRGAPAGAPADDATAPLPTARAGGDVIGEEVDPPLPRPYAPGPNAGDGPGGRTLPPQPAAPPRPGHAPPLAPGFADPGYAGHQVHQPYGEPGSADGRPTGRGRLIALVVLLVALLGGGGAWAYEGLTGGSTGGRASAAAAPASPAASPPTGAASAGPAASATASRSASASAPPSAGRNPAAAAKEVDALIGQSVNARQQVADAVAAVQQCVSPDSVRSAAGALGATYQSRRQLLGRLDALDVSGLPGGRASIADLQSAWQQSADADRSFQSWAESSAASCAPNHTPETSDYRTATQGSENATAAKKRFVLRWNQIAGQYGLPARTWDTI
jgi:hypothetical protein